MQLEINTAIFLAKMEIDGEINESTIEILNSSKFKDNKDIEPNLRTLFGFDFEYDDTDMYNAKHDMDDYELWFTFSKGDFVIGNGFNTNHCAGGVWNLDEPLELIQQPRSSLDEVYDD